ncbi:peptide chain release factor 1 [Platysternon megacephalum]|uniref:Peptide chain release factor 1 n=1 Tax=Platysternon megacephalum TaxID=55544 RepID=A0A4D9DFH0_9SAUR|nr:peptide chain release factor 1 [Platysternon megacephalum]
MSVCVTHQPLMLPSQANGTAEGPESLTQAPELEEKEQALSPHKSKAHHHHHHHRASSNRDPQASSHTHSRHRDHRRRQQPEVPAHEEEEEGDVA